MHRQGKASAPYEFGVKASVVTTNARAPGGQFVLHARTLPGNPYDGHTLGAVIEATERLTGREIERAAIEAVIKRELTRRSAIEAVIGHMKAEGHLGRCYLKGRAGDAANVILSAVGYNLHLVLAWLKIILRVVLLALLQTFTIRPALKPAS